MSYITRSSVAILPSIPRATDPDHNLFHCRHPQELQTPAIRRYTAIISKICKPWSSAVSLRHHRDLKTPVISSFTTAIIKICRPGHEICKPWSSTVSQAAIIKICRPGHRQFSAVIIKSYRPQSSAGNMLSAALP